MIKSLSLGIFDYINIWPVYYDFLFGTAPSDFQLVHGKPAELNQQLSDGSLDVSAISSIAYPALREKIELIPALGLTTYGPAKSVLLISKNPLEQCREVYTSKASSTASTLLKILLHLLKIEVAVIPLDYPLEQLQEHQGALVIGDEALLASFHHPELTSYDLGEIWREQTGRPFVWALWGIHQNAAQESLAICEAMIQSRNRGIHHIPFIAEAASLRLRLPNDFLQNYFQNFQYILNSDALDGLRLFYQFAETLGLIPKSPEVSILEKSDELLTPNS